MTVIRGKRCSGFMIIPDMQVRLNAAKATLAVAPKAARQKLEDIAGSGWPLAGDAGMSLWNLDRGVLNQRRRCDLASEFSPNLLPTSPRRGFGIVAVGAEARVVEVQHVIASV